ncbi:hypothetical protein HMPREF0063_12878 [Aeromicrobium marinum DSM 15272]|uniref:DUF6458 domain-containing protein n=1 Tax=Aeromicrobium marinum DSM 15272 TaxID=585531 RepID=E2SFR9_9ACTN|nr:DUF6458 family protein [Aeromicrobium marinum]EFQ81971.1 hypothetical protein HMPREF0063_12878 [Aeromicrobium marinum DSM 15272]
MYIGSSLALIAVGAILSFAVRDNIEAVDLVAAGYIMMAVGAVGLVASLIIGTQRRDRLDGRDPRDPPLR